MLPLTSIRALGPEMVNSRIRADPSATSVRANEAVVCKTLSDHVGQVEGENPRQGVQAHQ